MKIYESLKDPELEDILERDDHGAMMNWISHHIDGDWFTSRLLRLMATADQSNLAKLELSYPSIVALWRWYKFGRNPVKNKPTPRQMLGVEPYVHPDEERVL